MTVAADPPQAVGPGVLIADPGPLGLGALALLTVGEFAQNTTLIHTAGDIGLLAAALAWLAPAACVVKATWARTVFPVFPAKHGLSWRGTGRLDAWGRRSHHS